MGDKPIEPRLYSELSQRLAAHTERMRNLGALRRTDRQLISDSKAALDQSYELLRKTAAQISPEPPPRRKD